MQQLKRIVKSILNLHDFAPHNKLGFHYNTPTEEEYGVLRKSLVENYFSKFPPPFPVDNSEDVEKGFIWMDDHLYLRLEAYREKYIPFLNSVKTLKGSTVMDVGCGTGASLVALAEAGAKVYGIDIDQGSLEVAKTRCELYKTPVEMYLYPAPEINKFKTGVKFDFIIFNASLEHMLLEERLASLNAAWERLPKGGLICIIECPNRLWYFDSHTSELPFFDWLPHDLALLYTQFSPRQYINELYKLPASRENMDNFMRIGRGMSYHEIDLSIGNVSDLNIRETLGNFVFKNSNWLEKKRLIKRSEPVFKNFLIQKAGKKIHEGFFEPWLNIIIEK